MTKFNNLALLRSANRAIRSAYSMADGGKPKFANGGEANAEKITLKDPTLNTRFREKGYVSPNDPLGEKRWDPYDNNASNVPIKSYKVDYKTGELETLPTTFNQYGAFAYGQNEAEEHSRQMKQKYPSSRSNELLDMASRLRALHASQKFGGPKVSPEDMVAILNQEGRSDFGGPLPYKYEHDKKAVKLAKKLEEEGFFPTDTYLAASLLSAQNTAKRLKIPWQKVWNGTGSVPVWGNKGETAVFKGTTYDKAHMHGGLDYVNEFELNKKAALDPKNADLLSFVQKNMSDPPDIDALNQQEYEVREKDRQEFIKAKLQQNSQYNDSNRYGLTLYGPKDLATHAYNAATEGRNPFYWTDQDIEAREIKDLDKWYPKVVPPIKKSLK